MNLYLLELRFNIPTIFHFFFIVFFLFWCFYVHIYFRLVNVRFFLILIFYVKIFLLVRINLLCMASPILHMNTHPFSWIFTTFNLVLCFFYLNPTVFILIFAFLRLLDSSLISHSQFTTSIFSKFLFILAFFSMFLMLTSVIPFGNQNWNARRNFEIPFQYLMGWLFLFQNIPINGS